MTFSFALDTTIARPPAEVFDAVTDLSRLPQWQPRVVEATQLDAGPLGVGSRLREVRELRGKRLEQVVEVDAFEPGRRFGLRVVEGPLPVDGVLAFEPAGDGGTHLRLVATGRPQGAQRLLSPLLRVGLRREFRRQYDALKALVEDVNPAGAGTARRS
jgi:uncharacterized protein YndB with AHSA1/START domain